MTIKFTDSYNVESLKDKSLSVMWSGGCDSTLVLYDLLSFINPVSISGNSENRVINCYNFVHDQLGDKVDYERMSRAKFMFHLIEKKFDKSLLTTEIELVKKHIRESGCPQPALWLSYILPILPDNSVLFSGYHEGDCFFSYDIFSSFKKAAEGLSELYNKNIEFCTPLKYKDKIEVIKDLLKKNIYELTWYCESPVVDKGACGSCHPCILHKSTLKYITEQEIINSKQVQLAEPK